MGCSVKEFQSIICARKDALPLPDEKVSFLIYDTRKAFTGVEGAFFAFKSEQNDGFKYLKEAKKLGIKNWVVAACDFDAALEFSENRFNIFGVENTLVAFQKLATWKRSLFGGSVIGITGSNGKTIVKEWLGQLLEAKFNLAKSPKSFNSQIGVPLSVWQLENHHDLGIFEAGISQKNEMAKLEEIIQPTLGIFTNIGSAHDDGFVSREEKIIEKLKLFKNVDHLVLCSDHEELFDCVRDWMGDEKLITWSTRKSNADFWVNTSTEHKKTVLKLVGKQKEFQFEVNFSDSASIENLCHCLVMAIHLGLSKNELAKSVSLLQNVEMRLELKQGSNGCYLIDDTYNNDFQGLQTALEFMNQQGLGLSKTLIVSEFVSSSQKDFKSVLDLTQRFKVKKLVYVGAEEHSYAEDNLLFFKSTQHLLDSIKQGKLKFENELILVKGARSFGFERVVKLLENKTHATTLEINLNKLVHNFRFYKKRVSSGVKVMAMVKASAYGSGLVEIAQSLQNQPLDYLGVAYVDEGIELRKRGIRLPVLVMNAGGVEQAELCLVHQLEPALHSFNDWKDFDAVAKRLNQKMSVHLAIDTGMHRLGFDLSERERIVQMALDTQFNIDIKSVYSHLVGADEQSFDTFTNHQIEVYLKFAQYFEEKTGFRFLKHICNSAGILRFPHAHFDMVRLGIGLYGIDPTEGKKFKDELLPIVSLKSHISQLTHVPQTETVGYSRKGKLKKDSVIATLALGYGDGYPRKLGNGKAFVSIKGQKAYTVGNICMDLMMVDVTDISGVEEGDEVVVYGESPNLYQVAEWLETIPYEVLTNIGSRVKRVFFGE
ncbi:MAG: bifunctional UDP-N-acetylmuramoyl-tripeptide:D-alanyl-D-alanine ligase/alanine racemase [Cytophagales bacterium]